MDKPVSRARVSLQAANGPACASPRAHASAAARSGRAGEPARPRRPRQHRRNGGRVFADGARLGRVRLGPASHGLARPSGGVGVERPREAGIAASADACVRRARSPTQRQGRAEDRRFRAEEWRQWPFSFYADAFLAAESWWDEAASKVHGASPHHLALMNFVGRQALDTMAPSNFLLTNPVALKQTVREGGVNLVRGAMNYATDFGRQLRGERSESRNRVQTRRDGRGDERRRRQADEPRRDHPVRSDDRFGAFRAGGRHARLDHEVLYPRSQAREFADPPSRRRRVHGLLHLVAQPDVGGSRCRL